jgi:rfaE bifunctional protein nucleotidyltransferase chain/domain
MFNRIKKGNTKVYRLLQSYVFLGELPSTTPLFYDPQVFRSSRIYAMTDAMFKQPAFEAKICTPGTNDLAQKIAALAHPMVFTNGVFDILHRGHASYLAQARELGESLVVGVNSDASVRMLGKGSDRPINGEEDRMALVAALESVDLVILFSEQTPVALIQHLRPDIYVKGGDYAIETLIESKTVKSWGGKAYAIPFIYERSTTHLLGKIRS